MVQAEPKLIYLAAQTKVELETDAGIIPIGTIFWVAMPREGGIWRDGDYYRPCSGLPIDEIRSRAYNHMDKLVGLSPGSIVPPYPEYAAPLPIAWHRGYYTEPEELEVPDKALASMPNFPKAETTVELTLDTGKIIPIGTIFRAFRSGDGWRPHAFDGLPVYVLYRNQFKYLETPATPEAS